MNNYKLGVYLTVLYSILISCTIIMPLSVSTKIWIIRLIFFSILAIVLVLFTKYTWTLTSNVINKIAHNYVRVILKLFVILILFLANCSILFFNVLFEVDAPIMATFCFICLALYIKFLIFYFCIRLFQMPVTFIRSRLVHPNEANRWSSYRSIPLAIAISLSLIFTIYGIIQAALLPEIKRVEIKLKNFPSSMNGYSIVLLSDIHLGITITKNHVDKITESINNLDADIIVLVGDLTDISVANGNYMTESLRNFKSKDGNFFVTGNHEYYTNDIDNWINFLNSDLNFHVLNNKHIKIFDKTKQHFFYLAGVDDIEATKMGLEGHGMDLDKSLKSCDPGHSIILLAHQPKAAKIALDSIYNVSLVLSGHTHGGQMFPISIGVYLTNPFYSGLYNHGSGQVYVTQGTYYWGFPLRTFSKSEITYITLISE